MRLKLEVKVRGKPALGLAEADTKDSREEVSSDPLVPNSVESTANSLVWYRLRILIQTQLHPCTLPHERREWIDRLQGSNQLSPFKGTGGLSF